MATPSLDYAATPLRISHLEALNLELSGLGPVMNHELAQAAQYEQQITALERSLALESKKARENIILYQEKKGLVEDHIRLAKQNWLNAPMTNRALDESLAMVHEVEWKLPGIRSQLLEIRSAYDLGQHRAKALQADMEWKAKSDFEQWRSTLLGKSPLSAGQVKREWLKLLWRLLLATLVLLTILSFCRAFTRRT